MHGQRLAVSPAPPTDVIYGPNLGPLLTSVQVFTVFWGQAWDHLPRDAMNLFFDTILSSSLIDVLAEYSVSGQQIGPGKLLGTITILDSEPGGGSGTVTDAEIQQALQGWIANGRIPGQSANSLYFIYLPPGVAVTGPGGTGTSCVQMCGYHSSSGTSADIYYAVVPYPSCAGCQSNFTVIDAMTFTTSHELCEAITDPLVGTGWTDPFTGEEIGDICDRGGVWQATSLFGYVVQKVWSNKQGGCVACVPFCVATVPYPVPLDTPVNLTVQATDAATGAPVAGHVKIACGGVQIGPSSGWPTNVPFAVTLHSCRPGSEVLVPVGVVSAPGYSSDVHVVFGFE